MSLVVCPEATIARIWRSLGEFGQHRALYWRCGEVGRTRSATWTPNTASPRATARIVQLAQLVRPRLALLWRHRLAVELGEILTHPGFTRTGIEDMSHIYSEN
jgi:hypothetical protein